MCANDSSRQRFAEWRKCDANQAFYDGDQLLVAYQVRANMINRKTKWAYAILTVDCDEDYCDFRYANGDVIDDSFEDFEYWIPLSEFQLKALAKEVSHGD